MKNFVSTYYSYSVSCQIDKVGYCTDVILG